MRTAIELVIPGTEDIPQSMTTAPGFIQSPFTISGWPMATTKMSALAVCKHKHFLTPTFFTESVQAIIKYLLCVSVSRPALGHPASYSKGTGVPP